MSRASRFLKEEEREEISRALEEAEKRTAGEIVPVIATSSGRYDRAEDIFGFLTALAALGVVWYFLQRVEPPAGVWSSGPQPVLGFWWVAAIVVVGFVLGATFATYVPAVRLPFILRREMEEEVERRALEAFVRYRVGKTAEATGILIFISLFERMVVIRGDERISNELEQEDWNEVRDLILEGLRGKRPAEGLRAAILRCGDLLAEHIPIRDDDVNELTNEVHFLD